MCDDSHSRDRSPNRKYNSFSEHNKIHKQRTRFKSCTLTERQRRHHFTVSSILAEQINEIQKQPLNHYVYMHNTINKRVAFYLCVGPNTLMF